MNYYEKQEQKALEQIKCWFYAVGFGIVIWIICAIASYLSHL